MWWALALPGMPGLLLSRLQAAHMPVCFLNPGWLLKSYRTWQHPWFQAATGGLGTVPTETREGERMFVFVHFIYLVIISSCNLQKYCSTVYEGYRKATFFGTCSVRRPDTEGNESTRRWTWWPFSIERSQARAGIKGLLGEHLTLPAVSGALESWEALR